MKRERCSRYTHTHIQCIWMHFVLNSSCIYTKKKKKLTSSSTWIFITFDYGHVFIHLLRKITSSIESTEFVPSNLIFFFQPMVNLLNYFFGSRREAEASLLYFGWTNVFGYNLRYEHYFQNSFYILNQTLMHTHNFNSFEIITKSFSWPKFAYKISYHTSFEYVNRQIEAKLRLWI